ncbi:MAG: glycosyltransferase 87 family protein, partial [Actinomycetota bacterium]
MSRPVAPANHERREVKRPHGLRERFGGPPWLWRGLAVVVIVVSALRIVSYVSFLDAPELTENDYSPDYVSAREWRAGGDPYAPLPALNERYFGADDATARQYEPDQRNPHPPSLILFYAPLSAGSIETARLILLIVMLSATFAAVFLFLIEIGIVRPTAAVLGFGVLALPIVGFDLRWAQMNGLLLLSLVLAWRDIRRGHDLRAGLLLGAATALK